jgi:hypothetical protein
MMADTDISIDQIRDFFARVLAEDAAVLAVIDDCAENLQLLPQGFVFSLPALHTFFDPDKSIEYRDFRKLLYDSTLNQELSAFDAEVTLFRPSGKVDTSLYCLRHIPGA